MDVCVVVDCDGFVVAFWYLRGVGVGDGCVDYASG